MGTIKLNKNVVSDTDTESAGICELAGRDDGFVEELTNMRTANETVYRRNDRTCRKIITSVPTRYRDTNGEFKEISNRLIDNGAEIVNEANSFKVKFSKDLHSDKIFDLQRGGKTVSLSAVGTTKARGHACGCKCELCSGKYNAVTATLTDGTEIEYVTLDDRVNENIIVRERQDSYEYSFTLKIGDLAVEEGECNDLLLKDKETGETEFIIPAPFMFDANKKFSDKVSYEIEVNADALIIKVVAGADFINAADRVFPVTIDPQLVVKNKSGSIKVVGRVKLLNGNEDINRYENVLKVRDGNDVWDAAVTYAVPTMQDDIVLAKKLVLTVRQGFGSILVNGTMFNVTGKDIDIAVNVSNKGFFKVEPTGLDVSAYADFYTVGSKAPRFVFDYMDPCNKKNCGDNVIHNIDIADRAQCDLYVRQGAFATSFRSFESDGFILPVNITHIHKSGGGKSAYGLNWHINLDRKLTRINGNDNVRYLYVDEYGDKYIFKESYYVIKNGKKEFITDESEIAIDINGDLYYGDDNVYTYRSCNGYTLISQSDRFKHCDLLEQIEQEQTELEEDVQSYKNTLKNYVKAKYSDGSIVAELTTLTKDNVDKFFNGWNSSYVFITRSQAYQLQSMYRSSKNVNADDLAKNQYEYFRREARDNFDTVKRKFKKYFAKEKELALLWKQNPANYVKDAAGITSGFNKYGDLVCLYDSDKNSVMIAYNNDGQIQSIKDSNEKSMKFDYENSLLHSITDSRGRSVYYFYDDSKLKEVIFADGEKLNIKYEKDCLREASKNQT